MHERPFQRSITAVHDAYRWRAYLYAGSGRAQTLLQRVTGIDAANSPPVRQIVLRR